MSWMVTQLYSDVASRPTCSRRTTPLSVARLQSAGAGSGLETKRSALGADLSVDTYCSQTAAAVSHIVKRHTWYRIPRQVYSSELGTSLRRQTRSSPRGLGRLGPTRGAAHSARLFAAPGHNN